MHFQRHPVRTFFRLLGSGFLAVLLLSCRQPEASEANRFSATVPMVERTGPRGRVAQFQVGRDMPLVFFGELDLTRAKQIREHFQLVAIEPSKATAELVRFIQAGMDGTANTADDVLVLGYFSAGEDARTNQVNKMPLAKGDGTGPRIDPRPGAPFPAGNRDLSVKTLLGLPSPAGSGYASYYLDDNNRDGVPDRNKVFGGAFVNAGDPNWFKDALILEKGRDSVCGLKEILTQQTGAGLGCDGVMLDTFDTPVPNGWTDENSPNQCEFEWTASGFRMFVQRLRDEFPEKVIMVNRGGMFFNPDLGHYRFASRGLIDLFLFESFYSDSDPSHATTPYWHDNRGVYAPRINAEADRPDGFKVIAIGYKEKTMAQEIGTVARLGWFPELSDPGLTIVRPLKQAFRFPSREIPSWDSTYYQASPSPRVGLQQAIPAKGKVTVRWDVANAQLRPVRYNLYYQQGDSLDAAKAMKITHVPMEVGEGYENGTGPDVFPYEYTLRGLTPGTYSLLLRAEDAGVPALEEGNTHVLTVNVP